MPSQSARIAAALASAAREINSPRTLDETLDAIVKAAQEAVPGFNHAGLSIMHSDGRIETLAGSGQLVWELDGLQYSLDEGPCVDSIRGEPVVVMEHSRTDQRWPRYTPRAVEFGLRAQLAVRLYIEDRTFGGLNLYSTAAETVDAEARQIAEMFATHAAIALGRVSHDQQMNEALRTRKTIGQAIGIIMERYQISEDRAFQFLVRASSSSNIKLRVVAQEVVDDTNTRFGMDPIPN